MMLASSTQASIQHTHTHTHRGRPMSPSQADTLQASMQPTNTHTRISKPQAWLANQMAARQSVGVGTPHAAAAFQPSARHVTPAMPPPSSAPSLNPPSSIPSQSAPHTHAHTHAQMRRSKEKERFMLFSDHDKSLLRQQPGAEAD